MEAGKILFEFIESISHQVAAAKERRSGGFPSALAFSSIYVAVGMSRGLVLIFERKSERLAQYINPEKSIFKLVIFIKNTKIF